jgi:hypothetical protein
MISRQAKSAAPSSAFLAVSMMSIAFSALQRNFILIGGNLQCKSNHSKF